MDLSPDWVKLNTLELTFVAFYGKYVALKNNRKDWLTHNNVSEWINMSTHRLLVSELAL